MCVCAGRGVERGEEEWEEAPGCAPGERGFSHVAQARIEKFSFSAYIGDNRELAKRRILPFE